MPIKKVQRNPLLRHGHHGRLRAGALIKMAERADQAPGVVLMSEKLGERKPENEEDGEEEDGGDEAAETGRLPTI